MIKIKENYENLTVTKPAKAGIFYITTNFFTKLIALFATPLFTRLLLPDEYGVYSLYVSWMGIISVVLALGISGGAMYRALGRFRDRQADLVSCAVGILAISAIALFLVALISGERLQKITGLPAYINCLLVFEVFLNCAEMLIFTHLRYKYSYVKICLINLLYAVLSVGVALILVYFTPIKSEARIFSSFFASAVLILPLIRKHVNLKKLHDKEMQKYLLKLSIPLLPSALSSTLIAQLDKLMIERYESTSALGKYSIAYSVGFMLTTLTTALYSALQPWLMRKLNSKNTEAAGKITERIIFLTSLGLLLFLLLTPEIFRIVAAESYREAEIAVYPLAVAGFLQFISNILSANIIHSEKTVAISVAGLVAFVFNLLSNIALIPKYGYPAAAVTTALSYLLLIVIEYFYLKKHSLDEVVSAKALSPLLLILFGVPIYLIKDFFISRAIFAAVIVLLALPGLIEFIKSFLERRNEKTI